MNRDSAKENKVDQSSSSIVIDRTCDVYDKLEASEEKNLEKSEETGTVLKQRRTV